MRWWRATRSDAPARWLPPSAVGGGAAAAMAVRLFVPHPVGMANNGDAQRVMCPIGADADSAPRPTAKWSFVRLNYPFGPPGRECSHYPTTQLLQVRSTAWVHQHVLRLPGAIDTRELTFEYCVLVGIVMAVVAWLVRPIGPGARTAVLAALFLVLVEAAFADYAGSPYCEVAALYGVLVGAVAGVVAATYGRGRRAAYLVAWAAAVAAVGAKNEMVALAPPLALFLGTRRFEAGRLRGRFGARLVPALCVLSLAATAGWSLTHESREDQRINFAQEVTQTVIPLVGDPGDVAVGLGLPRSFGQYSGTAWWGPHTIESDPLYPRYQARFTQTNLGRFLAAHPVIAARVLSGGAGAYLGFRNTYLGTYPLNAGLAPSAQECRFCVLQDVSHAMKWSGFAGVLGYWILCLAGIGRLVRTSRAGSRRRAFALVALTLMGCAVAQYVAAVYGEGNEVTKHLAVALFAAALAPVWLAAGALHRHEPARTSTLDLPAPRRGEEPRSARSGGIRIRRRQRDIRASRRAR